MGKPVCRGTEGTTGHGCWPPTTVSGTASTVLINGKPAIVQGDPMAVHVCVVYPHPPHGSSVVGGSGTVLVEGKPLARIGDGIGCGDALASASTDVFAG